jgi:hypothetical protein
MGATVFSKKRVARLVLATGAVDPNTAAAAAAAMTPLATGADDDQAIPRHRCAQFFGRKILFAGGFSLGTVDFVMRQVRLQE